MKKTKKSRKCPKYMKICQNCELSDNDRGKYFQDGWNVWCKNRTRWYRWDTRKRCCKL